MQRSYLLDLQLNQGVLRSNAVTVEISIDPQANATDQSQGRYEARVISFDNAIINRFRFDIDTQRILEHVSDDGVVTAKTQAIEAPRTVIAAQFFDNAQTINIFDIETGQDLLDIPVGHFGQNCGDSVCQALEDYRSCRSDCTPSESPVSSFNIQNSGWLPFVALCGILVIVLIAVLLAHHKPRRSRG
ncbi:MAG: hypothetical protein A2666_03800 [Parcubacteria group bacterium RIFCSPHIGHO2_01_FULL_47_10b]|nr:MAG: hypothetical protein A2666_03800 [Parcubacteria group bacterium RIFCSPHIGHO2_01_FULL_47_10b]